MSSDHGKDEDPNLHKPNVDTAWRQQRLHSWQPLLTPPYVIAAFFVVGFFFIPMGIIIYEQSQKIVEVSQRYDDTCVMGTVCTVSLTIPSNMNGLVYFYYQIENMYQNHRRYVKSRSDTQLAGSAISDTSTCDPLPNNGMGQGLYPCGLVALSTFNDSYGFQVQRGGALIPYTRNVQYTDVGIAWKSDLNRKFLDNGLAANGLPGTVAGDPSLTRNLTSGFVIGATGTVATGTTFVNGIADEHFVIWMRTAGLPTFRKLWAKFPGGFQKDDVVNVAISNNYPTSSFNGKKSIVITTTSWLGGKNDFLASALLAVGGLCWVLAVSFWIKHCVHPRQLGDLSLLNQAVAAATKPART